MNTTRPPESSPPFILQYTGIPASWLKRRPSRNWLIFLSASVAIGGLYAYDQRKCRQLRKEYVDKVKHLSEDPLPPLGLPRKVTVYGSKWPGDEDADRSMKYFRKYVKVRGEKSRNFSFFMLTYNLWCSIAYPGGCSRRLRNDKRQTTWYAC